MPKKNRWTYSWNDPEAVLALHPNCKKTLQDFIDKHVEDMDYMLKKHYAGSVIEVKGYTFTVEADAEFSNCDCEIENLAMSGSKFNVDGLIVEMTPVFI